MGGGGLNEILRIFRIFGKHMRNSAIQRTHLYVSMVMMLMFIAFWTMSYTRQQ
jgi:hypothetical protein